MNDMIPKAGNMQGFSFLVRNTDSVDVQGNHNEVNLQHGLKIYKVNKYKKMKCFYLFL